jgi:hypothetical protein
MPSGTPRALSQGGKRCSSGSISALPSGESPLTASTSRLPTVSRHPARAKRVRASAAPTSAMTSIRLEGIAKKPRTLERMKNMRGAVAGPDQVVFFQAS